VFFVPWPLGVFHLLLPGIYDYPSGVDFFVSFSMEPIINPPSKAAKGVRVHFWVICGVAENMLFGWLQHIQGSGIPQKSSA
jgi:hypothetical protein